MLESSIGLKWCEIQQKGVTMATVYRRTRSQMSKRHRRWQVLRSLSLIRKVRMTTRSIVINRNEKSPWSLWPASMALIPLWFLAPDPPFASSRWWRIFRIARSVYSSRTGWHSMVYTYTPSHVMNMQFEPWYTMRSLGAVTEYMFYDVLCIHIIASTFTYCNTMDHAVNPPTFRSYQ